MTGLLDDYLTRPQLATELRRSEKTVARYERLPDGLPYTMIGNRRLYRRAAVLRWLESRERRPNPRRSA